MTQPPRITRHLIRPHVPTLRPHGALAVALVGTAACGHHQHHAHRHGEQAHHGHFADPSHYAAEWNDPARDAWQKPAEIAAALRLQLGQTALDIGAGTGYLLPALREAVGPDGHVVALDLEPAMVKFLAERVAKSGWSNVRVEQGRTDDPGLAPASIDAAVTLNVWHHVADRVTYAKRLRQTLRPGGTFVVVDFLKEQTEGMGPPLEMRLTAEQVAADLGAAGFETELVVESLPRHYIVRGTAPKQP